MNVGDYARTKYDGIIKIRNIKEEQFYNEYYSMGKVTSYQETDTFVYYRDDDMSISVKDIIKSSPNIIDLIEVGDYVNGHKVIYTADEKPKLVYVEYVNMSELLEVKPYQIKSIVTKEQFEAMKYEIK